MNKINFIEISNLISFDEFEQIKNFILEKGNTKTYRNFDNDNPYYQFENFDVFLGADIGQQNLNNDPEISNFNQLTISDWESDIIYYEIIIVRKGDLKEGKAWIEEGMKEEQVYLVDVYGKGLFLMEKRLPNYLKQIREEVKADKHKTSNSK